MNMLNLQVRLWEQDQLIEKKINNRSPIPNKLT